MNYWLIGLAIIVIILVHYLYTRYVTLSDFIGIYAAPDSFLDESGIEDAVLIINEVSNTGVMYGYLMMGQVITPIDINISWMSCSNSNLSATIVVQKDLPIPEYVTIKMHHGRIVFEDDQQIYLVVDAMHDF